MTQKEELTIRLLEYAQSKYATDPSGIGKIFYASILRDMIAHLVVAVNPTEPSQVRKQSADDLATEIQPYVDHWQALINRSDLAKSFIDDESCRAIIAQYRMVHIVCTDIANALWEDQNETIHRIAQHASLWAISARKLYEVTEDAMSNPPPGITPLAAAHFAFIVSDAILSAFGQQIVYRHGSERQRQFALRSIVGRARLGVKRYERLDAMLANEGDSLERYLMTQAILILANESIIKDWKRKTNARWLNPYLEVLRSFIRRIAHVADDRHTISLDQPLGAEIDLALVEMIGQLDDEYSHIEVRDELRELVEVAEHLKSYDHEMLNLLINDKDGKYSDLDGGIKALAEDLRWPYERTYKRRQRLFDKLEQAAEKIRQA